MFGIKGVIYRSTFTFQPHLPTRWAVISHFGYWVCRVSFCNNFSTYVHYSVYNSSPYIHFPIKSAVYFIRYMLFLQTNLPCDWHFESFKNRPSRTTFNLTAKFNSKQIEKEKPKLCPLQIIVALLQNCKNLNIFTTITNCSFMISKKLLVVVKN